MNKWEELVVGPVQTMLGLVINTYQLTVGILSNYMNEVLLLVNNTWHCGRKQFTVSKAQQLTRNLGNLAEGMTWIFHLLSNLYAFIAYALSKKQLLLTQKLPEDHGDIHKIPPERHQLLKQEQPAVCNATWICNSSQRAFELRKYRLPINFND
jgi:hypothetical protein